MSETVTESTASAVGEFFDPAIHATDADGNPIPKKGGGWRRKRGPAAGNTSGSSTPRTTTPRTARAKAPAVDYRPALCGLGQLGAAVLMAVSPLDAHAVVTHTVPIAEAAQITADASPGFAALLDKIVGIGPWSALVAATVPLGLQVAANHGWLPVNLAVQLGARDPQDIARELGLAE